MRQLFQLIYRGGKWGRANSNHNRERIADTLCALGLKQVFLLDGDSHNQQMKDDLMKVLQGKPIDFLFIDGDHTFRGVLRDWELYHPLVRNGGLIAFHDILENPHQPRIKVHLLWRVLKTLFDYEEFIYHPKGAMGIGITEYKFPSQLQES